MFFFPQEIPFLTETSMFAHEFTGGRILFFRSGYVFLKTCLRFRNGASLGFSKIVRVLRLSSVISVSLGRQGFLKISLENYHKYLSKKKLSFYYFLLKYLRNFSPREGKCDTPLKNLWISSENVWLSIKTTLILNNRTVRFVWNCFVYAVSIIFIHHTLHFFYRLIVKNSTANTFV